MLANSISPVLKKKIDVGQFNIYNIPIPIGKGEMMIRTTDINGNLRTIIVPYLLSSNLLSKGLSDYSFSIGIARQEYGIKNMSYKDLVSAINYSYGINDFWTSNIHIESFKKYSSIGTTNTIKIWNIGIISLSTATNLTYRKGNSYKTIISYSFSRNRFSFGLNLGQNDKNFYDSFNYSETSLISKSAQLTASYSFDQLGNLSCSFIITKSQNSKEQDSGAMKIQTENKAKIYKKSLSLSYGVNIKKVNLSFNANHNLEKGSKKNISMSLTASFNLFNRSINISRRQSKQNTTNILNITSQKNSKLGWSYKGSLEQTIDKDNTGNIKNNSYDINISNNNKFNDMSLNILDHQKKISGQFAIRGSVILIDRSLFFARPVEGNIALVQTAHLKNVKVYSNNQIAGYSNKNAKLLLTDIASYTSSTIALNPEELPLNISFINVKETIRPKKNTAIKVNFNIKKVNSLNFVLLNKDKKPLPMYTQVYIENIPEQRFVGYNGMVYYEDISENIKEISGKACNEDNSEDCCYFKSKLKSNNNEENTINNLGALICQ